MNVRTKPLCKLAAAVTAWLLVGWGWVPSALALQTVSTEISMPVRMNATVQAFDCENSPGPQITLEGTLSLGGVNTRLIFRNNENKDVHTRVEDIQVAVGVQSGDQIVIPKQPANGGVGGNPFIWVQLIDMNGNPLTGEIFLGRCVQGVFAPSADFATWAVAQSVLDVLDCTNNPGPYVEVWGSLSFNPGVKARIIFRNNDNPVGGPHEADAIADLTLIPPGFTLQFPKQPVQGGVGGNPWISAQFIDGNWEPIGGEVLLGRCVQLRPGN